MKLLAVGIWALALGLVTMQNSTPNVISVVSPSVGSRRMGVLPIDVTVSGNVQTAALVASLTREGVFEPIASGPLVKSGTDHYIAQFPLPTVTVETNVTLTVTDGAAVTRVAFVVSPPGPVDPKATLEHVLAVVTAAASEDQKSRDLILLAIANIRKAVEPEPAPVGIGCEVVSATTVYADGAYRLTLKCPKAIAPTPPAKGDKVQMLGRPSSSAVVK